MMPLYYLCANQGVYPVNIRCPSPANQPGIYSTICLFLSNSFLWTICVIHTILLLKPKPLLWWYMDIWGWGILWWGLWQYLDCIWLWGWGPQGKSSGLIKRGQDCLLFDFAKERPQEWAEENGHLQGRQSPVQKQNYPEYWAWVCQLSKLWEKKHLLRPSSLGHYVTVSWATWHRSTWFYCFPFFQTPSSPFDDKGYKKIAIVVALVKFFPTRHKL